MPGHDRICYPAGEIGLTSLENNRNFLEETICSHGVCAIGTNTLESVGCKQSLTLSGMERRVTVLGKKLFAFLDFPSRTQLHRECGQVKPPSDVRTATGETIFRYYEWTTKGRTTYR